MKTFIVAVLLVTLCAATSAFATGKPPTPAPAPVVPTTAAASADALATATAASTSSATGAGVNWTADSNFYAMPAPVAAAPLPAGLCPQGDSMSIGILWNMFSYARSSTRTEMECLDKVLAVVKAQTPAPVVLRLNDGVTAEPVICPLKPSVKRTAAKATKKGVCNA